MKKQFFISIVILNMLLTIVFFSISIAYPEYKFLTLEVGNTIMAILGISSYLLVKQQISNRPQAFVRGVNSATLLKLMVCMISILVYVLIYRANIHKPTIFIFFGIYIVYTGLETWVLTKMARKDK